MAIAPLAVQVPLMALKLEVTAPEVAVIKTPCSWGGQRQGNCDVGAVDIAHHDVGQIERGLLGIALGGIEIGGSLAHR